MLRPAMAMMLVTLFISGNPAGAGSPRANPLDTLNPGEWYEVPSSQMKALDPCPARTCSFSGAEGQSAVMDDWSGGAFDTLRDRLIVWGGGHGGYGGNEVYVFDLGTLAWQRLSNPSDPPAVDTPYASDGGPCSRHTYNYLQYLPGPVDRFVSFGGAGFYTSGQTGTQHLDAFNFSTGAWETQKFAATPANNLIGSITAVDPSTGHVWQHGGLQSWLSEFDPGSNQWTAHGDQFSGTYLDYYKTADVDPKRKRLVAVGNGEVWSWDLTLSGTSSGVKLTTTGATDILSANSPGFVYDPAVDLFVAWKGGTSVYTLNMDTLVWTQLSPAATNTVTPTAPNGNGTFGRFRYSPTRNVFVLVNGTSQDVFVYKLSAGGGTPPPQPPPPPTPPPSPGASPSSGGSGGGGSQTLASKCGCGSIESLEGGGMMAALGAALGVAFLLRSRQSRGRSL